jgi:hypothetical protein
VSTSTPAAQTINAQTPGPLALSHQMPDGFSLAHEIAPNCGKLVCVATVHNVGGWPFNGHGLDDEKARANLRLLAAGYNAFDRAARALGVDASELAERLDLAALIREVRAMVGTDPAAPWISDNARRIAAILVTALPLEVRKP